jgi:Lysyl oxidase
MPVNTRRLARLVIMCALIHVSLVRSPSATDQAPGALIKVTMSSIVGVVLDEVPAGMRDMVATSYLQMPTTFWQDRAQRQIEHTIYRLTYRGFFYDTPKGPLPLPPARLWSVMLAAMGARRETFQGHDAVLIPYEFTTTILTDVESPAHAEPKLSKEGGRWDEPFMLPLDPEFLLQRTGLACIDEEGFPPNTADSENARFLFDHTCDVETPETAVCHLTAPLPTESCRQALKNHVGRVDAQMHFERLPWDLDLANQVRIGRPTHHAHPDLQVIGSALKDNRIIYRYISADSCALAEGCVKGTGWRRLLQFTASIQNVGGQALAVGSTDDGSPLRQHNVFEFSACHAHFHYRYYGDFTLGAGTDQVTKGEKRAFCVESTQRHFNRETSPLVHPYSCDNQGVEAGWGDDYMAGIECQWVDITDVAIPPGGKTLPLTFKVNPEAFLCEGTPITDVQGNLLFEPTTFTTETGEPVDRPLCDFVANWDVNNKNSRRVRLTEEGSFVTEPCTRSQSGPLRDCGFKRQENALACSPGREVTLHCATDNGKPAQVVRVCETSQVLGTGVACVYRESLANATVDAEETSLTFTCPAARDAFEPGGQVSLYVAPVAHDAPIQFVNCTMESLEQLEVQGSIR